MFIKKIYYNPFITHNGFTICTPKIINRIIILIAEKNKSTDLTIDTQSRITNMKCNLIDDFPLGYSINLSNSRCAENGIIFHSNFDLLLINSLIHDNVSAVNYQIKKVCNENFIHLNDAFNQMNRDLYDLNNHINKKTIPSINDLVDNFNALEQTVIDNQTSLKKDLNNIKTEFQKETGSLKTEFQKDNKSLKDDFHDYKIEQKDKKNSLFEKLLYPAIHILISVILSAFIARLF